MEMFIERLIEQGKLLEVAIDALTSSMEEFAELAKIGLENPDIDRKAVADVIDNHEVFIRINEKFEKLEEII